MKRITLRHLGEETIHAFTHYEKGFLHTIWQFLAHPGRAAKNYRAGSRKQYHQPVGFILILIAIYLLAHNYIIDQYHYTYDNWDNVLFNTSEKANVYLRTHFITFVIPILLAAAVIIYYFLARPHFNFAETFVFCIYGCGVYFALLTISDLVLGMIFRINIIGKNVFLYQTILSALYTSWLTFDIFRNIKIKYFWGRLIVVAVIVALLGYAILSWGPLIFV